MSVESMVSNQSVDVNICGHKEILDCVAHFVVVYPLTLINSSNKPQIPGATFLCFPQIRVLVLVCIDDRAICQHNLPVGDKITCKPSRITMK